MPRIKRPPKKKKIKPDPYRKSFFATKVPFKKNRISQTQASTTAIQDMIKVEPVSIIRKKIQKSEPLELIKKECIPRKNFQMIIRDISREHNPEIKFSPEALLAMHQVSEAFMAKFFQDAKGLIKGKRKDKKPLKTKQIMLLSIMNRIRNQDFEPL
jgi:histone H3/H4